MYLYFHKYTLLFSCPDDDSSVGDLGIHSVTTRQNIPIEQSQRLVIILTLITFQTLENIHCDVTLQ